MLHLSINVRCGWGVLTSASVRTKGRTIWSDKLTFAGTKFISTMQRAVLVLTLILMCSPLFGQAEWHKKIPFNILAAPNVGLTITDDTYLVNNQNQFIQFGEDGRVLGEQHLKSPTLPIWQVSPNPATLQINILFEKGQPFFKAMLYNAQGQLLMAKTAVENGVELSVAHLPAGLYWVEVWQEGLFLGNRKVVITK